MATVDMTQQPGGSTIRSDAGPLGVGAGGLSELFQAMAARKMQTAEEDRRRKLALEDEMAGDRATSRRRDTVEYNRAAAARSAPQKVAINRADNSGIRRPAIGGENSSGAQLRSLQEAAAGDELDSASRGPIQRYVTAGPGIVGGGLTNDVSRMNAYQRKQYLPATGQLAAGPEDHDLGEEADRSGQFELRRRARTAVMERAAAGV